MATEDVFDWAIIQISGGNFFNSIAKSPIKCHLVIADSKIKGVINDITGIPGHDIPPIVGIPVKVNVSGTDQLSITFEGSFIYNGVKYAASGNVSIGVDNGTLGACNYTIGVDSVDFPVENAEAAWVQPPR